jgi:hypothetical protein
MPRTTPRHHLAAAIALCLWPGAVRAQDAADAPRPSAGALRPWNLVREPLVPDTPGGTRQRGGTNRTDYAIEARLERSPAGTGDPFAADLDFFDLTGRATITWTNASTDTVDDLWFHVYLNAFANNRSTHMQAVDGNLRGTVVKEGFGFTEIKGVRLRAEGDAPLAPASGADLLATLTWEQPTDGNTYDRTVFRVALPEPVAPGATVRVDVAWESRLPRVRRRTGTKGDFMLVAQWFPKLGVYESGRGWNCHQFHAFSEWYADYGTYDVQLDLPGEYAGDRVFGSGVRVNELRTGDRVKVGFQAPSLADRARVEPSGRAPLVHDFMWTADPDYVPETFEFVFAEWAERYPAEVERMRAALGPDAKLDHRNVTVEVLIQPERRVQARRHYEATAATLFFYGLWFGEYPFERITVVDPAWGASEAGGMEYPTIFTAGTRLFTEAPMHSPESVTIHEAGHQWFYLLVGNNEFEAAWLDEGLNSYADAEVLRRVFGDRRSTTLYARIPTYGVQLVPLGNGNSGRSFSLRHVGLPDLSFLGIDTPLHLAPSIDGGFMDWWRDQPLLSSTPEATDPRWDDRTRYLGVPDVDPIDNWPWMAAFRESHYSNVYSRTACVVRSLPALIASSAPGVDGRAAFLRGMRHYSELWRYRHPYPDDFFDAFQEGDGVELDLAPYFEDLFRNTLTVDWSVDVEQKRVAPARGAFMDASGVFVPYADFVAAAAAPQHASESEASASVESESAASLDAVADANASPPAAGAEPAARVVASSEPSDDPPYRIEVLLRRRGDLALPVPVRLTFVDGSVREELWTRDEQLARRWKKIVVESQVKLASAAIDPDGGYYLDLDLSDNQWFDATDSRVPLRYTERVLTELIQQFQWQKGLGG